MTKVYTLENTDFYLKVEFIGRPKALLENSEATCVVSWHAQIHMGMGQWISAP